MKIFVINSGSSSIKYSLMNMGDESVLVQGLLERVGTDRAVLHQTPGAAHSTSHVVEVAALNHGAGLQAVMGALTDPALDGPISNVDEIDGIGHRVVHGGSEMSGSVAITGDVIDVIRHNVELAPLHNPANLAGIEAAIAAVPKAPHVAVFDTAFLSTMPPRAYRYAVPTEWWTEHRVRRYGFHGTSHRFVTERATELMGRPAADVNLITCHLGNGCSITAIRGGRAVDHSMGMTPLAGVMMGTRSGDLDPAVVLYLLDRGMTATEVGHALNHDSGLYAISGGRNDMRDLLKAAGEDDADAELAVEMFVYRIAKYIGSYVAILPRVDAVVMTGGIGEKSPAIRGRIGRLLASLGVEIDEEANKQLPAGTAGTVTTPDSRLPMWCIPTDEELMIARDTAKIVAGVISGPPQK